METIVSFDALFADVAEGRAKFARLERGRDDGDVRIVLDDGRAAFASAQELKNFEALRRRMRFKN